MSSSRDQALSLLKIWRDKKTIVAVFATSGPRIFASGLVFDITESSARIGTEGLVIEIAFEGVSVFSEGRESPMLRFSGATYDCAVFPL